MPRSFGMTGKRWYECAQCGFDYPEDKLRWQDGVRRCTVLPCLDVIRSAATHGTGDPRGSAVNLDTGGRGERNLP
jgi:hypothetical protein